MYLLFTGILYISWRRIALFTPTSTEGFASISIIIPVRNEIENISFLLEDLNQQTLNKKIFEVIVIDDGSDDGTWEAVQNFHANYSLKILPLKVTEKKSHKKEAIKLGITNATGMLIVTTDGDCRVPSTWLSCIQNFYLTHKSKLIIGPVTFFEESSVFQKLQTIEFASLIGSGASCLNLGYPNMCNGANLIYEKDAFFAVNGFENFDHIASGDDEFLMHKIYKKFPKEIHFLKSKDAVVRTKAKESLNEFFHQRKRWASKWKFYSLPYIKIIAGFVFLYNAAFVVMLFLFLMGKYPVDLFIVNTVIKLIIEYLFLKSVLIFMGKDTKWPIFLLCSFFYPFYVSFFGLSSNIGEYSWKNRRIGK